MAIDINLNFTRDTKPVADTRVRMIAETSAFLTWALEKDRGLPRIPRRRVDQGGFAQLLRQPGARHLVMHWWSRVLSSDKE